MLGTWYCVVGNNKRVLDVVYRVLGTRYRSDFTEWEEEGARYVVLCTRLYKEGPGCSVQGDR